MPRVSLHYFLHQNSKFRHLIFFVYFVYESSPRLISTLPLWRHILQQNVGESIARSEKSIKDFCPSTTHYPKPSSVKIRQLVSIWCMNLKQGMRVEQGDYKTPKEKYYKWLTFLSNGLFLNLQDNRNMNHLEHFLQYSKLICRNVQPVVKSLDQLCSKSLGRTFQNICEWLQYFLK